ncbi:hypothetical protein Sa4125_13840 [Aureimonas sp. SA4125]|nr:hypothetical protein Sa4125_13840 [Aureimonas sp. SA4125]
MKVDEIEISIDDHLSEDPIFLIQVITPLGTLDLMAEVRVLPRSIEVHGLHVGGNAETRWGWSTLRRIGRLIAERLDVDEINLHGAIRTTGANPGRRPRSWRIARASEPSPGTRLKR